MKVSTNTLFWLGILGVLFFTLTTLVGGFLFPNYSHIQQLISESYATGTSNGFQLRVFGYLPSGLFLALFSFLAIRVLPKSKLSTIGFLGLGLFYGITTIIVSIFPCDEGCNPEFINPSISQIIHTISGALTYLIVPTCLILIGIAAKRWKNGNTISKLSVFCGLLAIVFVMLLITNPSSNYSGLYQRIVEGSILFWIVNCALYIKRYTQQHI
jgi:hypothetical protein